MSPGAEAVTGGRQPWRALYADAATFLSRGLVAGLICGLVIGGVGGRLAMFALRLTSGGALRGVETDDGFIIGSFTGATLFLVIVTGFLGAAGGLAYLGVCEWVPPRWRAAVYALLGATLGGAAVIRPEGVDFTELEPLRLAVAFFVILPAAYGAAVSLLAERLVRAPRAPGALRIVLLVLPFGLLATGGGPFGLAALALGMGASAANRAGGVARAWRSAPATWAGRAGLLGVFGLSGVALLRDVGAVL
ncbi:MAG: hypothetical protein EXR65_00755 [Dehalococcoidia bacterium]|nr:hypothetical protein [Dehalococcoidia bacterium]